MNVAHLLTLSSMAVALACGGCSSPTTSSVSGGPPLPPGSVEISIQDFSFKPSNITIHVGTTVRWTNVGPSGHTTTSDAGTWGSNTLSAPSGGSYGGGDSAGGSFTFKFTQAGTYGYHCSIHPPSAYPNFIGTVTVIP